MSFSAEIVEPGALSRTDLAHWRALCDDLPAYRSPLLSPEFALAVGAVRSDARVAVLKRRGATVGFLAHHPRPNGYARPIGAPFSDYHGVVADPAAGLNLADALSAAGLRRFRHRGLVGSEAPPGAVPVEGHAIDLGAVSADAHLEALRSVDAKRFKNWRRLSHKLDREQADISFGPDGDPDALRRVIGWKRAQLRRSGLHDVLRPAWVERMMNGLFSEGEEAFGGLLITLRVGGRPIAGHFGVRRGPVFHPWVAAFDPEFSAYSPGVLFMLRAIELMPALNLQVYDLSAGSDHYKKPFTNASIIAWDGVTAVEGARGRGQAPCPAPAAGVARRLGKRLEQIAAVEPSLAGRLRGLFETVQNAPKRLAGAAPDLS